ncbi:hypothetical protein HYU13_01395 [Candidatus Woesearchaeota archaeon]|nr:hypothetical protein [Candidatus Woesearchaeota archaeon]
MDEQDKKGLIREFGVLKGEVSLLHNQLNAAGKEKESLFLQKKELGAKIRLLISQVKEKRKHRDSINEAIQDEKRLRDGLHQEVKSGISKLHELTDERKMLSKKDEKQKSPGAIQAMIERYDHLIETEVMPFDKEKELMKKIKFLKKQYKEAEAIKDVAVAIKDTSHGVGEKKKDANLLHSDIQQKAKESQESHQAVIKLSEEIQKLEAEEEGLLQRCVAAKQHFVQISKQLHEKLPRLRDIGEALDEMREKQAASKKQQELEFLKMKEQAVEEKIKKGQKLTIEDIMLFQKVAEKEGR